MDLVILLHEERVSKHTPNWPNTKPSAGRDSRSWRQSAGAYSAETLHGSTPKRDTGDEDHPSYCHSTLYPASNGFSKFFLIHNTIGRLTMVRVALYFAFPEYDPLFLLN